MRCRLGTARCSDARHRLQTEARGNGDRHGTIGAVKIITDERCAGYAQPGHPEKPERITRTLERLRAQTELAIEWESPAVPEEKAILRAHSEEHLVRLREPRDFDPDTPYFPGIAAYARASAGAALGALEASRKGETVMSLMRPPGHHATRHRAMGFCYLNNVAIAALEALATGAKRIAIFDFDVHHGNGTESILLNRERAWLLSIHQSPCYPGTGTRNVGSNCFNYPVPPEIPRQEYRGVLTSAFEHLESLRPQIVGVCAGFDCYAHDPLAQGTLEAEDFYWLGQKFRNLGVPVFSLLEGGYSPDLPELIFAYMRGIGGK